MNINLMIYGSLILEVLGLIIGLWVTIKALVDFHYSKKYYKEYSTETGLKQLVFDMKNDGMYKEDEKVDIDRLLFVMQLQLSNSKKQIWKGIIAIFIMILFLIRTITIM